MVSGVNVPPALAWTLRAIDGGMILYWAITALACAGLAHLPASLMYDGYGTPVIDSWNWSFAPIDIALSLAGFAALALGRRGDPRWRGWAIVSLSLTFCAGLMAIAFWALQGEFDPAWWMPNLALVVAASWWLPRLVRG